MIIFLFPLIPVLLIFAALIGGAVVLDEFKRMSPMAIIACVASPVILIVLLAIPAMLINAYSDRKEATVQTELEKVVQKDGERVALAMRIAGIVHEDGQMYPPGDGQEEMANAAYKQLSAGLSEATVRSNMTKHSY